MPPNTPIILSFLFLILPFFFLSSFSDPNYNYNNQNNGYAELRPDFYDESCPRLPMIIRYHVWAAVQNDSRMAASLLRLNFHDCIVDVCKVHYLHVVVTVIVYYLVHTIMNVKRRYIL